MLIVNGAQLDFPDKRGRTPLIEAAYTGNLGLVKLLVGNGANVEAVDSVLLT